jgi:membrane protein insertase Oxa1/YidC/SpoIIIJ
MLMKLMQGIAIFYYSTWFIWPFLFLFPLVNGIADKIKGEDTANKNILISAIALLIILAGITYPFSN